MKNITLLFLCFFVASCEIEYDAETRLISEINVVDGNGNGLPEIPVSVLIMHGTNSDEISYGVTDADGKLRLIFAAPKNDSTKINIQINRDRNIYNSKTFSNILKSDFNQYKLVLDDIQLYNNDQLTTLLVDREQITFNASLSNVSLEGSYVEENVDFETNEDQYIDYPLYFKVLKNQEVLLHYTVTQNNTSPVTNHSVPVTIGSEPVNYVINY